jgi:hypothetical protein
VWPGTTPRRVACSWPPIFVCPSELRPSFGRDVFLAQMEVYRKSVPDIKLELGSYLMSQGDNRGVRSDGKWDVHRGRGLGGDVKTSNRPVVPIGSPPH